ncbi:MAG: Tim44 domain-containing protein [Desulfobaccales bacterium]
MPRRPDLAQAILGAGLIFLALFLAGHVWSRQDIRVALVPIAAESAGPAGQDTSFPPVRLATAPGDPATRTKAKTSAAPATSRRSILIHWLSGGFLGSLLYRYVFGYPLSDIWQEGPWPPGLLDFVTLLVLGFLGYWMCRRIKNGSHKVPDIQRPRFLQVKQEVPPAVSVSREAQSGLAAIKEMDKDFDLQAFVEEAHRLLLELYEAWNRQQLSGLNGKVKESLLDYLQMGLKIMALREESSFLEDLTLESIMITAAGVDDGREHITVLFQGRLLDYVLDTSSGKLLLGSMAYPAVFQEYWELERPRGQNSWVLHDIRES